MACILATINHRVPFLHDRAALFIGCKILTFSVELTPGGVAEILFSAQGVPPGSRIIRLNYTANGPGLQPIELHGNDVSFRRGHDTIYLYGRSVSMPANDVPSLILQSPVKITVYVTFAEPSIDEQSKSALAQAFAALAAAEYMEMVIPATMAIEFTCKQLINALKSRLALNDKGIKDKDLLSQVIAPIATAVGVPPLAVCIIRKIRRLWGQRDNVAHEGRLWQPYGQQNASAHLAAAVFAFRYLQLLRRSAEDMGLLE
jgi:hypothetical protein